MKTLTSLSYYRKILFIFSYILTMGNLGGKINIFSSFSPITGYSSYSTCSGFTIQKILK